MGFLTAGNNVLAADQSELRIPQHCEPIMRYDIIYAWYSCFTLALHALAEQALEQPFAVLADGGSCVRVHVEGVRHFDSAQHHLFHPDGPAAPGWDSLSCLQQRPLLHTHTHTHS